MGYAGAGAPNLSYAGSAIDDPVSDLGGAVGRRLGEHELHRAMRYEQRAELSALQGARYGGGGLPIGGGSAYAGSSYGDYDGGYGAGYGRGYDDIDGYGYGRRSGRFGMGRRALADGIEAGRFARAGGGLGAGGYM